MAVSPLLHCECIHCANRITAAEKRRNGFECDRCIERISREEFEWSQGAEDDERDRGEGRTFH